jgi:hypothetical protein
MIFTITGPTCAGKSTLKDALVKEGFTRVISTTTRPKHRGEFDCKDYYFVPSRDAFEKQVQDDTFIEHVEFGGHYYGVNEVEMKRALAKGAPVVLVTTPLGAKQIRAYGERECLPVYSVFVNSTMPVMADRFLNKFIAHYVLSDGSPEQAVMLYSRRFVEMMVTEQEWVREAERDDNLYTLRLKNFDGGQLGEAVRFLKNERMYW